MSDKPLIILHMRGGGVYITQFRNRDETVDTMAAKMTSGGCAGFEDSMWHGGRRRELSISMADVSVTEIIYPRE